MTFFSSRVMPRLVLPTVEAITIAISSRGSRLSSMAARHRPQLVRTRTQKTQPTKEKMAESADKRQQDDGIMTFVLGAMRKRSAALGVSHLWWIFDPLEVLYAIVDGRPPRTLPGIAFFSYAIPDGNRCALFLELL
ncbi:hypothetical protein [Mesorhizobium dulcispinae]|uniref:hypothetical protein n=1 Tax=Mesorhizobium dulcispinae TaxID=3072316 RepID=UPI002A24E8D6|nr:hypothetical protein [Mesorhizobium sp. VK23D]MDX8517826.1 hypothetical protein [Mesorhizobium sp. VK23D]